MSRLSALDQTIKGIDTAISEIDLSYDGGAIFIEDTVDKVTYHAELDNAIYALKKVRSLMLKQKYGFLNTEF